MKFEGARTCDAYQCEMVEFLESNRLRQLWDKMTCETKLMEFKMGQFETEHLGNLKTGEMNSSEIYYLQFWDFKVLKPSHITT